MCKKKLLGEFRVGEEGHGKPIGDNLVANESSPRALNLNGPFGHAKKHHYS